jgi:hypothetical protein
MTDRAESVAFDASAPQSERADALSSLQKSHMPSLSDLLPSPEVREVIDQIQAGYAEQAMLKAINPNVVPFPSRRSKAREVGMQSVYLDDWNISVLGEYWERPSAFGFDSLRMMVDQTPILNAVIMTRARQVQRFCRVQESDVSMPGFEIRHVDRKHKLSKSDQDSIQLLNKFVSNCGWEFNPRRRKALRRDSFSQFMGKAARDSLTMDSCGIETEWKRDRKKGLDGFYLVDGGSIRLCSENGYRGDDEIFALQVVQGLIRTAYTFEDLIYEARNPRSDVRVAGYGYSETELLVKVVTGFLNAMTVNIKGFDSNSIPKGMLHLSGNYKDADIAAFKQYWNMMVRGVNNAWALPVMVSSDQESKASFEKFGVDFNEMMFAKWMTFLTSIICAIYGMSPSEINFDSFTGGSTSALSGSDTAEKLAASKDSGLRPLLAYFENTITDFIISDFSDQFVFRWTGLDPEDLDKKHELRKLVLTIDELRAEEGYEAHPDPALGAAPANPSLMGPYMQSMQDDGDAPGGDNGKDEDQGKPKSTKKPQDDEDKTAQTQRAKAEKKSEQSDDDPDAEVIEKALDDIMSLGKSTTILDAKNWWGK